MNVKKTPKPTLTTYDDRLRDLLRKCRSLTPKDRQMLYDGINEICQRQVADCADGLALANLLALRRLEAYGKKRMTRFISTAQEITDDAVKKYGYATAYGLRTMLKAVAGVDFALNGED